MSLQDDTAQPRQPVAAEAVFTSGSTMRHVINMTVAGATGLMAIFAVDIVNLFYIAQLGDQVLTAALGFGATIMFFSISLSVGLGIATTALTARALGAGDPARARQVAAATLLIAGLINVVTAIVIVFFLDRILAMLGAQGRTFDEALHFTRIVVLSSPFMGIAMCLAGILRARGDAKRAMYVTLSGAITAAIFDPILILGFELEITGAAIATTISRLAMLAVGYHGAQRIHRMIGAISRPDLGGHARQFLAIAAPAVLTQLATPVGNAYVTGVMSGFGDDAIAGWTIVGRIIPLAFGGIFSLSGAIGPIISRNFGAGRVDRIRQSLKDALVFTCIYTIVVWGLLALFRNQLVDMFDAEGDAAELVLFFCLFVASSLVFNGALFVGNAVFNNLGKALLATLFNWGRATLGVIPFVHAAKGYGAIGVLAGWGLGAVVFGICAVAVAFRIIAGLPERPPVAGRSVRTPG